jgi:chromosome segregation ATPase
MKPYGTPYENTTNDWAYLLQASKAARYPIRTKHDDQIWYNLTSVEAMRKRGEELTSPYREYEANYRDALKRAEYSGPTPVRQKKIQAAQEEMAALQAQLEEAQKPVEPPARGTPEYWTWRPEMLEAKRAERQETISRLQAQIDELARRVENLHAPTDYQARKMRRAQREAEE